MNLHGPNVLIDILRIQPEIVGIAQHETNSEAAQDPQAYIRITRILLATSKYSLSKTEHGLTCLQSYRAVMSLLRLVFYGQHQLVDIFKTWLEQQKLWLQGSIPWER